MKTVLITGANKGIGFETAKQLLQAGYQVFIGSRDPDRGQEAISELKGAGYDGAEILTIDVANPESVKQAAEHLSSKITRLDVLINNAGIAGDFPQDGSNVTQENIRSVFDTNFFGVIQTTQAFLPLLRKSKAPRIVNVSSDLGSLGSHSDPDYEHYDTKLTAYCSSKTALNAYTVMLAYELRNTNFKVNSVNPGYTKTDFNFHQGHKSIPEGAAPIVKYATIGSEGPTGSFLSDHGVTPW
jgi:NAD(P)-dependent dehydrogenase (short-subunit alcohol dehydrogenase family)